MRRFILPILSLFWLVSASHLHGQTTKTQVLPAEWIPPLAPSISAALQNLKTANSKAEMNALSREIADMTDAQLFVAYVRLYDRLGTKERAKLVAEQAKWLKARSKAAQSGVESTGGSLAPLEANNAELTFTEKRLKDLRARLKTTERKKAEDE